MSVSRPHAPASAGHGAPLTDEHAAARGRSAMEGGDERRSCEKRVIG